LTGHSIPLPGPLADVKIERSQTKTRDRKDLVEKTPVTGKPETETSPWEENSRREASTVAPHTWSGTFETLAVVVVVVVVVVAVVVVVVVAVVVIIAVTVVEHG
jgi:hypothetical protein